MRGYGIVCAIDRFLAPAQCRWIRACMDTGSAEPAEVLADGAAVATGVRLAIIIEPHPAVVDMVGRRLDDVRPAIARHYGYILGGREGSGFVRYERGGFYVPHRDVADDHEWRQGAHRRISIVVFLNSASASPAADEFSGGELVILEGERDQPPIRITPKQGQLVAFPAGMLHEVQPVRAGTRDVIVDWYY